MIEEKLIFIISQPRSGSTLLQTLLANHSKIDTTSEHWMLLPFLSILKPHLSGAKYDQQLASDAFINFLDKYSAKDFFFSDLKKLFLSTYSLIQSSPDQYVIDKTPRYYEIFDEIYDLFPKARFIILKRHPLAVFSSIMKTWDRYDFKSLAKHHTRDLLSAPQLVQNIEDKYGMQNNVNVVYYESLVKTPEETMNSLFSWLTVNPVSVSDNYEIPESVKGKYGDPVGIYSSNQLNATNLDKWMIDLNNQKTGPLLKGYAAYLKPEFLKKYGYEMQHTYRMTLKFRLFLHYSLLKFDPLLSNIKSTVGYYLSRWLYNQKI